MCDRVFKVPYIILHLDKVVFSFDIHILIKKMLLICMESFKKMSKQNAITWQTITCDCGLLTVIQDFACAAWEEIRTASMHQCHFFLDESVPWVGGCLHLWPQPLNVSGSLDLSVIVTMKVSPRISEYLQEVELTHTWKPWSTFQMSGYFWISLSL